MIDEKKRFLERKKAKKQKELKKKTRFDLDALKREIFYYHFRVVDKPYDNVKAENSNKNSGGLMG